MRMRALVSGHVQGVGFRWAVRERAVGLGLTGFAHNLSDGRVEVEAEGDRIDELAAWLHVGPPSARVAGVDVTDIPDKADAGFQVG